MISLLRLNKLSHIVFVLLISTFTFTFSFAEDEPIDIWEKEEEQTEQKNQNEDTEDSSIESPILSEDINKIEIKIDETEIVKSKNL